MLKKYFILILSTSLITILIVLSQTQFIQELPENAVLLTSTEAQREQINRNVFVSAKALSNSQFASFFSGFNYFKNRDIRNKYKAIEIEIENDTNNNYVLSSQNIELSLLSPKELQSLLKTSRILGPLSSGAIASGLFIFGLGLAYIPSVVTGGAIGSSTQLINIEQSNKTLQKSIANKSIDQFHPLLIPEHETIKTIVFVENKNLKKEFKIGLENFENQFFEFDVSL